MAGFGGHLFRAGEVRMESIREMARSEDGKEFARSSDGDVSCLSSPNLLATPRVSRPFPSSRFSPANNRQPNGGLP